jgi:hypothetical protein
MIVDLFPGSQALFRAVADLDMQIEDNIAIFIPGAADYGFKVIATLDAKGGVAAFNKSVSYVLRFNA